MFSIICLNVHFGTDLCVVNTKFEFSGFVYRFLFKFLNSVRKILLVVYFVFSGMLRHVLKPDLQTIIAENNHSFAAICLKALKLGKLLQNDDLNSFLV